MTLTLSKKCPAKLYKNCFDIIGGIVRSEKIDCHVMDFKEFSPEF